jgi:hypothetical protein
MGAVVDVMKCEFGRMDDRELSALAETVAREMAFAFEQRDGIYISTPLLFGSGAPIVVRIDRAPNSQFLVSDVGAAFHEAMLSGADHHFKIALTQIAANAGVRCDGRAIFVNEVEREQLVGAVTVIANCSREIATLAEYRNREQRRRVSADQFYTRVLTTVKKRRPQADIARDVEIRGNSTSEWTFDVGVRVGERRSLFGVVSPNAQAVAFASTKCSDVMRLPDPPTLVSVVESTEALGRRLGWLLPVSQVIEGNSPDKVLLQLSHAA